LLRYFKCSKLWINNFFCCRQKQDGTGSTLTSRMSATVQQNMYTINDFMNKMDMNNMIIILLSGKCRRVIERIKELKHASDFCSTDNIICWEPEGCCCCTKSMALAPFWFSANDVQYKRWHVIARTKLPQMLCLILIHAGQVLTHKVEEICQWWYPNLIYYTIQAFIANQFTENKVKYILTKAFKQKHNNLNQNYCRNRFWV